MEALTKAASILRTDNASARLDTAAQKVWSLLSMLPPNCRAQNALTGRALGLPRLTVASQLKCSAEDAQLACDVGLSILSALAPVAGAHMRRSPS